jgi:hypothetical protein
VCNYVCPGLWLLCAQSSLVLPGLPSSSLIYWTNLLKRELPHRRIPACAVQCVRIYRTK